MNLKYYLKSRDIGDDYNRLRSLLVADHLCDNIPAHLNDFVKLKEIDGWLPPRELAQLVDRYNMDRKLYHSKSIDNNRDKSNRPESSVDPNVKKV